MQLFVDHGLRCVQATVEDAAATDARWAEMLKHRKVPSRKRKPESASPAPPSAAPSTPGPRAAEASSSADTTPTDAKSETLEGETPEIAPAKRRRHTLFSADDVDILLEVCEVP